MARLIDADALEKHIADSFGYPTVDILHEIANFPTVDAVEVVHGRWMDFEGDPMWQQCSACEYIIQYSYSKDCKYCPNCSAYMRGK